MTGTTETRAPALRMVAAEQLRVVLVVGPDLARVSGHVGSLDRELPLVGVVGGQRVVAVEQCPPVGRVLEPRGHVKQVPNRDPGEPNVALAELRQMVGDGVVDARDEPFVDGDADKCRDERLGHGTRSASSPARRR